MSTMAAVMPVLAVLVLAITGEVTIVAPAVVATRGGRPWPVPAIAVTAAVAASPRAPEREDSQDTESNRQCNHLSRPFTNPG